MYKMDKVEVIKVALPKTERQFNRESNTIGKKRLVSKTYLKGKKALGSQGYMTVADWERKAFHEYGINPNDVLLDRVKKNPLIDAEMDAIAKENAQLKARLEALEKAAKSPVEVVFEEDEETEAEVAALKIKMAEEGFKKTMLNKREKELVKQFNL
jgi:hypothetical protein